MSEEEKEIEKEVSELFVDFEKEIHNRKERLKKRILGFATRNSEDIKEIISDIDREIKSWQRELDEQKELGLSATLLRTEGLIEGLNSALDIIKSYQE